MSGPVAILSLIAVCGRSYCSEQPDDATHTLLVATTNSVKAHHLMPRGPPVCEDLHPHGSEHKQSAFAHAYSLMVQAASGTVL